MAGVLEGEWYRQKDLFIEAFATGESVAEVSKRTGVAAQTFSVWRKRHGLGSVYGHKLPVEPVADVMNEFLAKWKTHAANYGHAPSPLRMLSEMTDLNLRYLTAISNKERKAMFFDQADRILCAMEMQHEWYGRLNQCYWPPGEEPEGWPD